MKTLTETTEIGRHPHYEIGTRRVWWNAGEDGADWQVRVSVCTENGTLTIQSGPSIERDGTWGDTLGVMTHSVSGYSRHGMVEFARWVQEDVVGDAGIVLAVEHLIDSQKEN